MQKNYITGDCPVAFIAKGKQRIKQYNNETVYLKDGDEFSVELFNPTKSKVLARIEMNGKSIGPGIILRPGERVFLERYVNDARKFKFETYKVSGDNEEVKKAIEDNGDVIVKFFKEEEIPDYVAYNGSSITISTPNIYNAPMWSTGTVYTNSTGTHYSSTIGNITDNSTLTSASGTLNSSSSSNTRRFSKSALGDIASASCCFDDMSYMNQELSRETKTIETGRVEKGSYSNQKFEADYSKFQPTWSWKSEWKILPESRKPITADDLVTYCPSCGRRRRANENYCPSCGYKF